jgi:hypothetical protein
VGFALPKVGGFACANLLSGCAEELTVLGFAGGIAVALPFLVANQPSARPTITTPATTAAIEMILFDLFITACQAQAWRAHQGIQL